MERRLSFDMARAGIWGSDLRYFFAWFCLLLRRFSTVIMRYRVGSAINQS